MERYQEKIARATFIVVGALAALAVLLFLSSCSLIEPDNLLQQVQAPVTLPDDVVLSDATMWQAAGDILNQWGYKNRITELFTYTAEVTLLGLTTAMVATGNPGLGVGAAVWLGLLKIFQPTELGLVYVQGAEDIRSGGTNYILCLSTSDPPRRVVPRNIFTPCGAQFLVAISSAVNSVERGRWGLRPRRSDLDNVQPVAIEMPQSLRLPKKPIE